MITNLKQLMKDFSDEQKCRDFLVRQRWNGVPVCPYCNSTKSYVIENGKRFKCGERACYKKYSVTVGTVFHASNIPLNVWFPAMYLISAHKKGISSIQLSKDLGVTQKTAWFMLHRIRQSLKDKDSSLLQGIVEVDETYVGGRFKNKHKSLRKNNRVEGNLNKSAVMGYISREGSLRTEVFNVSETPLLDLVKKNVDTSAQLITDGSAAYYHAKKDYPLHEIIYHARDEYSRDGFHTNTIEGFWAQLKRSIYGIYHRVSPKHLTRYCDESTYRYNSRKLKDGERFELSLQNIEGRLPYKQLVYGKSN